MIFTGVIYPVQTMHNWPHKITSIEPSLTIKSDSHPNVDLLALNYSQKLQDSLCFPGCCFIRNIGFQRLIDKGWSNNYRDSGINMLLGKLFLKFFYTFLELQYTRVQKTSRQVKLKM